MSALKTPLEMFVHWESALANEIFMHQPIRRQYKTYTWQAAGNEVRSMASYLKALGYPPGTHIAILSKNCAHWILADLAIWMAGYVSVPLYPNLNAETIRQILEHSECKLIFVGKLDGFAAMKPGITDIEKIAFPRDMYGVDSEYREWNEIVAKTQPAKDIATPKMDSVATIIYTSGTTGMPKGVVHTFGALSFAGTHATKEVGMSGSDRFFSYLPLSHVAERFLVETGSLYVGGSIYFAESLDTFAEDLRAAQPTAFLGVPRIWSKFQDGILKKMPQAKLDKLLGIPLLSWYVKKKIKKGLGLDKASLLVTGAAPMAPSLMHWFQRVGITITEAYGMTENLAYSHLMRQDNWQPGTVGQPWPHVEVRIGDDQEIQVKSAATMVGYYKEPEKTKEMFDGEFLRTGDQGSILDDGTLKITGRVKDLFKTSKGKFVAPSPIELKLSSSEHIECVCVVGSGMAAPLALVTRSEVGKGTELAFLNRQLDQLLTEVNASLDAHERLSHIVIVEEDWTVENGVLTPSMKIKRNVVESKYAMVCERTTSNRQAKIVLENCMIA